MAWIRRTKLLLLGIAASLLLSILVVDASATSSPELIVRSWLQGMDVRQQSVTAMLQSRDGYLWIGTGLGLMRFDGVSFTRFTSTNTKGMAGDRIAFGTLWEDPRGAIWAGTDFQGVVCDDHGQFRTLQVQDGLADPTVLRIDGDESGVVWIETLSGLNRWRNGRLERVHPEQDGSGSGPLIPLSYSRPIDFAKTGLWRYGRDGLERFAYGRWSSFPTMKGAKKPFEDDVRFIYEDHLRRVWYSLWSEPGTSFCAEGAQLRIFHGLPPEFAVSFQDSSGFLWLTDSHAHSSRWKDGKLYPLAQLKTPFLIQAIEMPDGSIWAGSAGTRLFQFRRRRISLIPTSGSPELASVLFRQRSGMIWAGGRNILQVNRSGRVRDASPDHVAGEVKNWIQIKALSEDASGDLLIGSRARVGIERLKKGVPEPYLQSGAIQGTVQAMLRASSGEQWVGTTAGLYRITDGASAKTSSLLTSPVRCLFESSPGTIWAGTQDGPALFLNGQRQQLATGHPWRFGTVVALKGTPEGVIWMATQEHGVVRYSGDQFQNLTSDDGLPTNNIYSIEVGDDGDLWLGSDAGLTRIRRKSLERKLAEPSSKLQLTLFDDSDGLPASTLDPLGNEGSLKLPDGHLWFATEQGIADLDPVALLGNQASTHTVIEEHAIDGFDLLTGPIMLRPEQKNLELHYTALGSKRPEQLNFRYRLNGFDKDWVSARDRRVAYYTQLPPGSYRFEVQASDGDSDLWGPSGATAAVKVLAPFYLTWWFNFLVFSCVACAVFFILLAQRRTERERSRVRQAFTHHLITTQEGERKRIAHELHDSLGQHLVLIRTLAMLPARPADPMGIDQLSKIADQAITAIREVETISYDLRPYQLDRLGLTKAILSLIETFQTTGPAKVTHSIDNIDGFLPKDLEINFYRIVQEAFGNILKHAHATKVQVTVALADHVLQLTVADDGRGFSSATTTGGSLRGLGLIGIQERAEALGGHAVIQSTEHIGTEIIVIVTQEAERRTGSAWRKNVPSPS